MVKVEFLVTVRENKRSKTHLFSFLARADRDSFVRAMEENGWEVIKSIDKKEEREL